MRLAILNLTGGGISGGYKNYLENILPLLSSDPRIESVLCVSPRSLGAEELAPAGDKLSFAECAPYRPFNPRLDRGLELQLSSYKPDVIFVPTARKVCFRDVPVVTMLQNMAPLVSWEWYSPWHRIKLLAQLLETRRAIKSAVKVVAISDFVGEVLISKWGIPPEKVSRIYFGVPFHPGAESKPESIPADWGDFVFTAGSIEPYRSLEDIVECARLFKDKTLKFVVAGAPRPGMENYGQKLKTLAEKAGVADNILWIGQLPHGEMTWCYRNCLAFVMTSRVEAGPNTVLEAMACGAISVAADNPPLPEFFGEAAEYYAPGSGLELAEALREIQTWDAGRKAQFRGRAAQRAAKFTWKDSAERLVALFEECYRKNRADKTDGSNAI